MIVLGIETSGRAGSVAVSIDGTLAGERDLTASGRRHARTLVPEISDLLRSVNLGPRDVQALAVSIGPGSFTGLRVGVVSAKTFAYAVGCPLIAVDSFLAVAWNDQQRNRLWVIDDALRGDLFAGLYVKEQGEWRLEIPATLRSLEEWRTTLTADDAVTGPGLLTLSGELPQWIAGTSDDWIPHARQVVRIGARLAAEAKFSDPWTLAPVYMRRSAAEEKADQASATAS